MTLNRRSAGALLAFAAVVAALPASAQQRTPATLVQFLRQGVELDDGQLARIEKGQPVVKVLDTKEKADVAVFGIVTVNVSRDAYVARIRDFRTSLRTPTRTAFGLFSDPPTASDVQGVVIDSQDVEDLKRCKAGDCKLKLPAAVMAEVHERVNGNGTDARVQTNTYARQRLLEYVTDYRSRGDEAMVVYDDRGNTRASEAFNGLLAQSPYIFQYVPTLQRYLASYPKEKLAGVTDVMFWSIDSMPSLRPILNVNHLSIYSPPELEGTTLLASKQIFANHYFEALFDLTTVIDRPGTAPGIYLLVIRRFRFDRMPSIGMINLKGKVAGKLKDQMNADLENEKVTSERVSAVR
jgi:hypothetical protein